MDKSEAMEDLKSFKFWENLEESVGAAPIADDIEEALTVLAGEAWAEEYETARQQMQALYNDLATSIGKTPKY